MSTSMQRRRENKVDNKPRKNNSSRMALIDHFRNDDHCHNENHSMKRRPRLLLPTKLKRFGLMMISGVFGQKKTAQCCCFSVSEKGLSHCKQCESGTKSSQQTSMALKVPAKVQLSFKNLFIKKRVGFSFSRGKSSRDCGSENGFDKAAGTVIGGREESSGKLQRVSSRIAIQRMKIGGGRRVDAELCKKRILMGERCRPLSISGTLNYDEDGILLPDVLP